MCCVVEVKLEKKCLQVKETDLQFYAYSLFVMVPTEITVRALSIHLDQIVVLLT